MPRHAPLDRPLGERALAWLYTGPLGHLWGAVADISVLWARWIAGRAKAGLRSWRSP
jgi:hypothetical protein